MHVNLKKILFDSPPALLVHFALFLLRVLPAAFLMTHGIPKLSRLLAGEEIKFADPIGLGPQASLVLAVFAEVICSFLVFIGFATRIAGSILVIFMGVIIFIVHAPDPFGRKELPLMYLLTFLTLAILGGGKYSVDGMIGRKSKLPDKS